MHSVSHCRVAAAVRRAARVRGETGAAAAAPHPATAHQAAAAAYTFTTLNDQADPAFSQLGQHVVLAEDRHRHDRVRLPRRHRHPGVRDQRQEPGSRLLPGRRRGAAQVHADQPPRPGLTLAVHRRPPRHRLHTLTADGVGQAAATLGSSYTGSIPSGSTLVVLNGTASSPVDNEPIAQTASLSGSSTGALPLTAVEVAPNGTSYGTPAGTATLSYNSAAQTLTVTVNASGLTPGNHAAHIHFGSCQDQGPVVDMLMDLTANSAGKIVNQTRVLTGVTSAIPVNDWYLNIHQGNSNNILKNGAPTILFRPLLCANA